MTLSVCLKFLNTSILKQGGKYGASLSHRDSGVEEPEATDLQAVKPQPTASVSEVAAPAQSKVIEEMNAGKRRPRPPKPKLDL